MKIIRNAFGNRQNMLNPNFELLHMRDTALTVIGDHYHDFYEVYFLNQGHDTQYSIEGTNYLLRAGDVLVIDRMLIHKIMVSSKEPIYDRYVLWISPAYLKTIGSPNTDLCACFGGGDGASAKRLIRLDKVALGAINDILYRLEKSLSLASFGSDLMSESYLRLLMVYLNRAYQNIDDETVEDDIQTSVLIDRALKYINENLSGELALDKISEFLFISKYHLERQFKRYVGYSVHKYIMMKRLIRAEEILRAQNNFAIRDVGILCGFGDTTNFIRAFTKHYGYSPKQFKRKTDSHV